MSLSTVQLEKIFVEPGHVSIDDFNQTVAIAKSEVTSIELQLVASGLVSDYNLGKTIADTLEYPFCDLAQVTILEEYLTYIPEIVAQAQQAIVYKDSDEVLYVATTDPENFEFQKLLEKKVGKNVVFSYASPVALQEALTLYKGDYQGRVQALVTKALEASETEAVVELVNLLLEYGYESRASDLHFEPLEHTVRVRFRIDGVLHEVVTYPHSLHESISFRVKILSRLQTDEQGKAQDGRFSYTQQRDTFDVRVSIIPVLGGENIVMRLLSSYARQYSLEALNFSAEDYKKVLHAMRQPHGMILTVGPTGSGKTTVLYAILEKLNRPEVNLMTIEDPVEYDVENVQQTQVNKSKGLVFATGLRSIVRQDPDIIMVGEIRDEETADIAVNAAMTGHLLLSTLHTNDAATTFPRLNEMGVEPFLVASSIRLIVSLRLVRKICIHCKESYFLDKEEQELIKSEPAVLAYILEVSGKDDLSKVRFYRGAGCKTCHHSTFEGRAAIFEVLEVDSAIRVLVSKNANADEVHDAAVANGMKPLLYDGVAKALNGTTTIMEVVKTIHT